MSKKTSKSLTKQYKDYLKFCEECKPEQTELRNRLNELYEKINNKLMEIIDLEGKYIFIKEDNKYIYVEDVFKHGEIITVRGYGFNYQISDYVDWTFCHWDWMIDHKIFINCDIKEELSKISIIDKDEFDTQFEYMLDMLKDKHKAIRYDIDHPELSNDK